MGELNRNTRSPVTCPLCKHKFEITLGKLEDDKNVQCPDCHKVVYLGKQFFCDARKSVETAKETRNKSSKVFGDFSRKLK